MTAIDRVKARLIEEWGQAWKFWSVQFSAFAAAFMAAYPSLPSDVRAALPYANWIAAGMFVLTIVLRYLDQRKKPNV